VLRDGRSARGVAVSSQLAEEVSREREIVEQQRRLPSAHKSLRMRLVIWRYSSIARPLGWLASAVDIAVALEWSKHARVVRLRSLLHAALGGLVVPHVMSGMPRFDGRRV